MVSANHNDRLIMLKQQLQQKLQQKLSPAQIQVIKMLEVPTLELEERIRKGNWNPALEEGAETNDDEFDEEFQQSGWRKQW